MSSLPQTSANTTTPQATQNEIKSLKKALGLIMACLPQEQRIKIQQELLSSLDPADRDLASQLNQFIFIE
ncbi:hypothetical protein [Rahnella bonaserana]